jgi:hypothetical protein
VQHDGAIQIQRELSTSEGTGIQAGKARELYSFVTYLPYLPGFLFYVAGSGACCLGKRGECAQRPQGRLNDLKGSTLPIQLHDRCIRKGLLGFNNANKKYL